MEVDPTQQEKGLQGTRGLPKPLSSLPLPWRKAACRYHPVSSGNFSPHVLVLPPAQPGECPPEPPQNTAELFTGRWLGEGGRAGAVPRGRERGTRGTRGPRGQREPDRGPRSWAREGSPRSASSSPAAATLPTAASPLQRAGAPPHPAYPATRAGPAGWAALRRGAAAAGERWAGSALPQRARAAVRGGGGGRAEPGRARRRCGDTAGPREAGCWRAAVTCR